MRRLAAILVALALAGPAVGQAAKEQAAKEKDAPASSTASLDALWAEHSRLDAAGDVEGSAAVLANIVRLRVERNIAGLEPMALALVAKGLDKVRKGERERAEQHFQGALGLDPRLPDAYLGYAQAQIRRGPLGIFPALRQTVSAVTVGLETAEGRFRAFGLFVPVLLIALLAAASGYGLALLLRHGTLLLHDLEEEVGTTRGLALARGAFLVLLLLPLVLLQGYGWLPLWWLGLLFLYFTLTERLGAALLLLAALSVGPLIQALDARARMQHNPLYRAALAAVESGPDAVATTTLQRAAEADPQDRDLRYLLARQYRKEGREQEAAEAYRELLRGDPKDPVALNNLANIEFYRGDFPAAIARYTQGTELGASAPLTATFYYNLAQARLQKFDFQPATEARAHADRLAADLTRSYESRWRYEKSGTAVAAVVDLGLSVDQLAAKFGGRREGVARQNVALASPGGETDSSLARALANRFLGFALVFVLTALAVARWHGNRFVTLRCSKCGAPFRRRVTTQDTGALCTQCFHLFVVKDGVSPSARNKKLMEVQVEDARRHRTFRVLSLLLPGAGQVFGGQALPGLLLLLLWFALIATAALAGRLFSVTGASSTLLGQWILAPLGLLLLLVYVVANRLRPKFEAPLPVVRRAPRRPAPPSPAQ